MSKDIKTRMNDMYQRDCLLAWFDVALLWATVIFTHDKLLFCCLAARLASKCLISKP